MKIQPGDICIIIGSYNHPESIGGECLVVAYSDIKVNGGGQPVDVVIRIRERSCPGRKDGNWLATSLHLKKKPPKVQMATWDLVRKTCGWNPTGVKT